MSGIEVGILVTFFVIGINLVIFFALPLILKKIVCVIGKSRHEHSSNN